MSGNVLVKAGFKPYALPIFSTLMAVLSNIINQKYGTFVPDWLILLLFYLALGFWFYWAWHTKKVRSVRALLYTKSPPMLLGGLIIIGAIVGAAAGAGLWLVNRAEQRIKATPRDVTQSPTVATASPSPVEDIPNLKMRLGQAAIVYDSDSKDKGTFVLIEAELRNDGSDTATYKWRFHYKSDNLDTPIGLMRLIKQPYYIPLLDEPRGAVAYYNSDSIVEKTAQSPVKRGTPVFGRIPLWVPGNRVDELGSGKAIIEMMLQDWKGRRLYARYQSPGTPENKTTVVLPGEKVVPLPADPPKRAPKKRKR